jgi:hypothetical protein
MYPLIASAIVGAVLMGRTKPKTKMRSLQMFGPQTGTTYVVEVMPGGSAIVVHDGQGCIAIFQKNVGAAGFRLLHPLAGTREGLIAMNSDFAP